MHEREMWNEIVTHAQQQLVRARESLGQARLWLTSDWYPVEGVVTEEAAEAGQRAQHRIQRAIDEIEQAENDLSRATDGIDTPSS